MKTDHDPRLASMAYAFIGCFTVAFWGCVAAIVMEVTK